VKRAPKFLILAAAAASAFVSAAAADAALVVRSAGPSAASYPPGRSLGESAPIALKPGDMITVLVSNATRVLRGPGTFKVGALAATAGAAFNARGRFGAMRAGEIPASPSLWHVDVSQSGTICVAPDLGVKLWRPEAESAVTLTLAAPAGTTQTVEWAAEKDELAWPASVPVSQEGEYRLTWTGNDDPTRLRFVTLASVPNDADGLAKAFIDNGCQSQLDLFIESTQAAS
jgi:hypothetical protein